MRRKVKTKSNRIDRHYRIRKRVIGTVERPRLSLHPSLKHLEAQIIDDYEQKTLLGISTKAEEFQKAFSAGGGSAKGGKIKRGGNVAAAVNFGKFVAKKAKEKGIQKVVFDRGGYLYHGKIKAFADAAREEGLSL